MLHIICLAVSLALHHWAPVLQGGHRVMIAMDNTSVVSYINKQGDMVLIPSSSSSGPIPVAALPGHLQARHKPGCHSVIADHLSRPYQPISIEFSLHPEIAALIFELWGSPNSGQKQFTIRSFPSSCLKFPSPEH